MATFQLTLWFFAGLSLLLGIIRVIWEIFRWIDNNDYYWLYLTKDEDCWKINLQRICGAILAIAFAIVTIVHLCRTKPAEYPDIQPTVARIEQSVKLTRESMDKLCDTGVDKVKVNQNALDEYLKAHFDDFEEVYAIWDWQEFQNEKGQQCGVFYLMPLTVPQKFPIKIISDPSDYGHWKELRGKGYLRYSKDLKMVSSLGSQGDLDLAKEYGRLRFIKNQTIEDFVASTKPETWNRVVDCQTSILNQLKGFEKDLQAQAKFVASLKPKKNVAKKETTTKKEARSVDELLASINEDLMRRTLELFNVEEEGGVSVENTQLAKEIRAKILKLQNLQKTLLEVKNGSFVKPSLKTVETEPVHCFVEKTDPADFIEAAVQK